MNDMRQIYFGLESGRDSGPSWSGIGHPGLKVFALGLFLLASCILHPASALARQAILSHFMGTVEVQSKGSTFWRKASKKMFLKEGEKVRTGKRSKATLLFEDGSRTEVSPDTVLSMSQLSA